MGRRESFVLVVVFTFAILTILVGLTGCGNLVVTGTRMEIPEITTREYHYGRAVTLHGRIVEQLGVHTTAVKRGAITTRIEYNLWLLRDENGYTFPVGSLVSDVSLLELLGPDVRLPTSEVVMTGWLKITDEGMFFLSINH